MVSSEKYIKPSLSSGISSVSNKVVDVLQVELHLHGYRLRSPGTNLEERLAHGEHGINKLDELNVNTTLHTPKTI